MSKSSKKSSMQKVRDLGFYVDIKHVRKNQKILRPLLSENEIEMKSDDGRQLYVYDKVISPRGGKTIVEIYKGLEKKVIFKFEIKVHKKDAYRKSVGVEIACGKFLQFVEDIKSPTTSKYPDEINLDADALAVIGHDGTSGYYPLTPDKFSTLMVTSPSGTWKVISASIELATDLFQD